MKNEIEQIIVNHIDRKISLGEATTQILRLFAVSNRREQLIADLNTIESYWNVEFNNKEETADYIIKKQSN